MCVCIAFPNAFDGLMNANKYRNKRWQTLICIADKHHVQWAMCIIFANRWNEEPFTVEWMKTLLFWLHIRHRLVQWLLCTNICLNSLNSGHYSSFKYTFTMLSMLGIRFAAMRYGVPVIFILARKINRSMSPHQNTNILFPIYFTSFLLPPLFSSSFNLSRMRACFDHRHKCSRFSLTVACV